MKWLFASLLASSLVATENFELVREDESQLIGYYDKPESGNFPVLLIIPGGQKESSLRLHESLKELINEMGYCAVTLEKRGVGDEKEYNCSYSLNERIEDHQILYENLKKNLKGWNGNIAILGQGDGGRIGAHFASELSDLSALILVGTGGGWPALEETLYSFRTEMAADGYPPQYIHSFLVQAREEFDQAVKNPKSNLNAFGHSYKYWKSLFQTNLLADLGSLDCPIYTVHAALDDRIPVESSEALANHLKDKITYVRKNNSGREIVQELHTYEEALSWLKNTFNKN